MRWNSHLFFEEGKKAGYNEAYLTKLLRVGRNLDSQGLPVVFSLANLARCSRVKYEDLHAVVARRSLSGADPHYRNFPIRKRSGGKRWISVPVPQLLVCQSWIATNILNNVEPHPAAAAYYPGRTLKAHADQHCSARWLVKLDIRDFFGNVSERQVYAVFERLGYPRLLCFELARICTRISPKRKGSRWTNWEKDYSIPDYHSDHVGSLPQGAPTSPALSNLVFQKIDGEIEKVVADLGGIYSRYADDLCMSFYQGSREQFNELKDQVAQILWRNGFSLNKKKTRIIPPGARKIVTGLVVNGEASTVPKEVRSKIRMHLYHCRTKGIPSHCEWVGFNSLVGFRNHLLGLVMYVKSIDFNQGNRFLKEFNRLPWPDIDY